MLPQISIIVPVYNAEKYVLRCLDALVKQTYNNIEIIAIDDGSQDTSWEIVTKYAKKDNRIKPIRQENGGPGKARQTGLKNALGKYIMFCDSDDWFEPDMCAEMINAMEKNDVDFACCQTNVVDEEFIECRDLEEKKYYHNKQNGILNINPNNILKITGVIWNKIYKKEIIDKYNLSFNNTSEGEDTIFSYSYKLLSNKAFFIDRHLYNYYRNISSLMTTMRSKKNKNFDSVANNAAYLLNFLQKHNLKSNNINTHLSMIRGGLNFSLNNTDVQLWYKIINPLVEIFQKYVFFDADYKLLSDENKKWLNALKNHRYDILLPYSKKIKILGISLLKIKSNFVKKTIYCCGIPIWIKHYT